MLALRALALATLALMTLVRGAAPLGAQTPPEPDPFYVTLLHEGVQAYDEGDPARAVRDLRLACFGLLEHPPRLAACLARLALAQAAVEDRSAFTETFNRLAVAERRFAAYGQADLPAAVRSELEQRLVRWIPADLLAEVPTFRPLADRQRAAGLAQLPPARRREELAGLVEQEPDNPVWRLLLAELELEEKNPAAAASHAEAVLAIEPASEPARCLRGLARARQQACGGAVTDLAACSRSAAEEPFAEALLGCRVSLGQSAEAVAFYGALPPALRESRKLARLAREAERRSAEATAAEPEPGESGETRMAEGEGGEPATAPASPLAAPSAGSAAGDGAAVDSAAVDTLAELSPADQAKLEEARRQLRETRYAGELEEPLRLAREVADAHPGLAAAQHLAAQIAYRASKWQQAADYFRRGGDPGEGQPVLLFYMAVSFYEVGDAKAAAVALRRALPRLEKTPFVNRYVERILGPEEASRWTAASEAFASSGR